LAKGKVLVFVMVEGEGEEDFVELYVKYASDITVAPVEFHRSNALFLLSCVVKRDLRMELRHGTIHCHIWNLILGKTSMQRKSTSIDIAVSILPDDINRAPHEFSQEAFIASLAKTPQCAYIRDEFGGFLSDIKKKNYMASINELFCWLFNCSDEPYSRLTKGEGEITVKDSYFTLLSGTTQSRFQNNVEEDDIESGFLPRFIFSMGDNLEWRTISKRKPEQTELKDKLKTILNRVYNEEFGAVEFTQDALVYYDDWLRKFEGRYEDEQYSSEMAPFFIRLGAYAIKISMLLWAQYEKRDNEIGINILQKAIDIVEKQYLVSARKVVELIKIGKIHSKLEWAKKFIKERGEVTHSELLNRSNLDIKDLQPILDILFTKKLIVKTLDKTSGRTKVVYKWVG